MIKEAFLIGEENKYEISKGEYVIGRSDSKADIKIKELNCLYVSRTHCKIYNDGEKLEVIDIGSRNGTYVNELKLTPKVRVILKNLDKLRLGGCGLEVKIVE